MSAPCSLPQSGWSDPIRLLSRAQATGHENTPSGRFDSQYNPVPLAFQEGYKCIGSRRASGQYSFTSKRGQALYRLCLGYLNPDRSKPPDKFPMCIPRLQVLIPLHGVRCCCKVWDGLQLSPRTINVKGAKLCTCLAWLLRLSPLTLPYLENPMPISRLRLLMQLCLGSQALPVEESRLARPAIPWHLRRCTVCSTQASGG